MWLGLAIIVIAICVWVSCLCSDRRENPWGYSKSLDDSKLSFAVSYIYMCATHELVYRLGNVAEYNAVVVRLKKLSYSCRFAFLADVTDYVLNNKGCDYDKLYKAKCLFQRKYGLCLPEFIEEKREFIYVYVIQELQDNFM